MTDGGRRAEGPTSGTFCPACGDAVSASSDRPVSGDRRAQALCDRCYLDRYDVVDAPEKLTLTVCRECGAVHREGEWSDIEEDADYATVAIEAVREQLGIHIEAEDVAWAVDVEQVDATSLRLRCSMTGTIRERRFEETVTVPVTIGTGTCRRCGRIAGDDHAAIVQIRASDRSPTPSERTRAVETAETYVADRSATGDRDAFISDVEETSDGVDIRLSRPDLGRGIAERVRRQLGGNVEHSRTLVTEDAEGDPVYRVTSLVRLARFRSGDVIDPDDGDGPVLVRSVDHSVKGTRLWDGRAFETSLDADGVSRIGHRSDAVPTTVVAVEDEQAVQVLHPRTQQPTTVTRPAGLDGEVGTVTVLPDEETLHILDAAQTGRDPES